MPKIRVTPQNGGQIKATIIKIKIGKTSTLFKTKLVSDLHGSVYNI